ncbi:hypothetical protein KBY85_15335 [Cyanobium sp. BA5m-10]|uniref:hypothetical protein n=1 Tax=Cyanobium sp. BA5m-10 TaxID=2823705 RepID=UPI0020CEDE1D|nr:hypothetical protein [Cyanobium sp. BA5m-10]MCP9905497.1 hypothetical protein [Cyanobium sp. BA5m-10]
MADELTEVVSARLTPAEAEHAKTLGSGSASAGVRRSLRLSSTISGATTHGAARLSQLLEQALPLAHGLEQVAAADVVAATSGAAWMPRPTAGLLLEFRRLAPGSVLALPHGVLAFGTDPAGADSVLAIDLEAGQFAVTALGQAAEHAVQIDGAGAVAAICDAMATAHHLARLAVVEGRPISTAVAECPALKLRIHAADQQGQAVIEVAGSVIQLHPLGFLELMAECHCLLARTVAQSFADRQQLEGLLEQPSPAVSWQRTHGEP